MDVVVVVVIKISRYVRRLCVYIYVCVCMVGNGSMLSVNPVTVSSAATYTCAAYNNFTEGNASVQLIVHCECHVTCDVILCDRDC